MKKLKRIVDENADDSDLPTRPSNDMTTTEHQTDDFQSQVVSR